MSDILWLMNAIEIGKAIETLKTVNRLASVNKVNTDRSKKIEQLLYGLEEELNGLDLTGDNP